MSVSQLVSPRNYFAKIHENCTDRLVSQFPSLTQKEAGLGLDSRKKVSQSWKSSVV